MIKVAILLLEGRSWRYLGRLFKEKDENSVGDTVLQASLCQTGRGKQCEKEKTKKRKEVSKWLGQRGEDRGVRFDWEKEV